MSHEPDDEKADATTEPDEAKDAAAEVPTLAVISDTEEPEMVDPEHLVGGPPEPALVVVDEEPLPGETLEEPKPTKEEVPTLGIIAEPLPQRVFPEGALDRPHRRGKSISLDAVAVKPVAEEEVRRPKKGETTVVYRGLANLVEIGDYRFRPDQPVIVPSEVVDELLTMPFEPFEVVKE